MEERTYRFAGFELNLAEGELRTADSRLRLQEKPLLLLSALLDHPQRLVTREQLRKRMWDSRTVVDYEQGINVAMKKVRAALGDSADDPKFIETVAKKGYRFLVPVSVVSPDAGEPLAQPPPVSIGAAIPEPIDGIESAARASVHHHQTVSHAEPGNGPDPVGRDGPAARAGLPIARTRQSARRWLLFAVVAALSCIALGFAFFEIQIKPRHPTSINSLAVLPLQDLSPAPGQAYLADGITEEVITNLAQALPLRVISRTSVMRYKRTDKSITQIARELGVEAIVEGAIARSGNRVSVTVQLIDATADRHLWAQKYERGLEDIIAMESELSQAIASQVGTTLSVQHVKLRNARPVDPQVYELYLMGRYHWNQRTVPDLTKAEEYFQEATRRDPTFAAAYAGLADVYALWPHYGTIGWLDTRAKAVAAARHALDLDDTLAEPHATLGLIDLSKSPEWMQTEPEFRRALELNPNYASAHHWFAYYLFFAGRRNEAVAEIELARQLDPLSSNTNADEGHFLYAVRRYEEARARLQRAIELEPGFGQPHETLALIELETGHQSNALREARTGLALDSDNPRTLGEAGYVLASTGQTAEAQKLLATLQDLLRRGATIPTFPALVAMGLGRRAEALDTLAQAVEGSSIGLQGLGQWHGFDPLKGDARLQGLLTRVP